MNQWVKLAVMGLIFIGSQGSFAATDNCDQALLLVNGGTRYPQAKDNPAPAQLDFARICHSH